MSRHYNKKKQNQRVLNELKLKEDEDAFKMAQLINSRRRCSVVSQISLKHLDEYHPQQRLPPNGIESQDFFLFNDSMKTDQHETIKPNENVRSKKKSSSILCCCCS